MEIGPITGIRPVAMSPRTRSTGDLTAVFQVAFRNQAGDETYSPSKQAADGRFEEEEVEKGETVDELEEIDESAKVVWMDRSRRAGSRISFFA